MALKRQNTMMAAFSMASMTDVIFLLLIFFMVTSTFVFPTALEVNLPESSKQTALKPSTRVYIDKEGVIYATADQSEPVAMDENTLLGFLQSMSANAADGGDNYIAVYADEEVTYGALVRVLDLGAQNNLKMVLATKPAPASARPSAQQAR
ncbi:MULTISPECIES: ExbD/TolR family protein [Duncaniella]|jgi:biopolymer transport protein ExbD|uniref:Biopolymer transporter ExbD n=3 Tax=Duncaniella muris TaxID=2094150 RepID=A0A2V1IQL4_9BACT|nr:MULTISPECIES: biopolymer transporter ExbD [Duncaniella]NBH93290.1 biopolymer transporter ExbD [Muribaculaceae bacterium S4]NBI21591.1 biopolymer transporter ExbD [Muribaculaceae bacterium Z1]ROS91310.1 biopolymer transporter ExbD [Muribaculaceae bacterium Isolate-039 (Harlan)]ROS95000.1 biopolymer transporter ExbD [Muribaculaceae bacterium Isolate-077 (Janvier)]ROS96542.1 biopolymer transporter ExbD [Muribaculaceae bacterium Isolate-083 (Janvier)]ROS98111.1 biopolymer transporter ExbD [Mur